MGLFDWLRSKPRDAVTRGDDAIWLTPQARQRGLCRAMGTHLQSAPVVVVAAHFAESLETVRGDVEAHGWAYAELDDGRRAAAIVRQAAADPQPHLLLALAENLTADPQSGGLPEHPPSVASPAEVIVAERHFLRERDEAILAFAAGLGCPARVTFHLSLRDPLLRLFAGEWMESVLGRLGAKEAEPVVSNLVSRRLRGAQDKFAHLAATEHRAASAEEWLTLNVPE